MKVGYHPAAYDEAFDDLGEGATPYLFLSHMLGEASIRDLPSQDAATDRLGDADRSGLPRADGEWVDGQSGSALRCACVVRADLDAVAS